jgi:glucose/arabinose dehydrogenase
MFCSRFFSTAVLLVAASGLSATHAQQAATPHILKYAPGKSITLSLPANFDINVAASGLRRVRFFAQSPDGRIFVSGMHDLSDNTNGAIYILDGWDAQSHTFTHVIPYLEHLRNPNNLAFYTDPKTQQQWMYLPLTDRLVRYKYSAGETHPASPPEVLTRFPDYGLSYKYGGWHLTRTVAIATLHGETRVYVTTGSSCNYCKEREAVRAALVVMDPDGTHEHVLAHGLRNAVDLRFVDGKDGGALFATNMGDDHLGDQLPDDTFFELDSNNHPGAIAAVRPGQPSTVNYGWPTCYFAHGQPTLDHTPLPELPPSDDARTNIAERVHAAAAERKAAAADSVYGSQKGVAADGTNLAAQVHDGVGPDLGPVPAPLTRCNDVPSAFTTFTAHGSPLGFAYFAAAGNPLLADSFLVALHGASHPHIGTGYRVVRFTSGQRTPQPWLTGFLTNAGGKAVVYGRPCGLLRVGPDSFLVSDDYLGLIYFIHPRR